ncbi:MAG: radical SAM protein [Anaerotruncus massiliensis (ex Togo et al. 2019)]
MTSGRTLSEETDAACEAYREIGARCGIARCASHELLDYGQLVRLREAGVTRYHCNLETSRRNFPNICTTHTYDEKCAVIRNAARQAGGVQRRIIGMGETMEDRVDLAIELRELGVRSVPVNLLNHQGARP